MAEQKSTALNALEAIKGIVLTHMEQDVDYDYEENPEYSYHEEYDGTIEDNYPDEIKKGVKRCGLTHKQWEKKKRERKNRKEARKRK